MVFAMDTREVNNNQKRKNKKNYTSRINARVENCNLIKREKRSMEN